MYRFELHSRECSVGMDRLRVGYGTHFEFSALHGNCGVRSMCMSLHSDVIESSFSSSSSSSSSGLSLSEVCLFAEKGSRIISSDR